MNLESFSNILGWILTVGFAALVLTQLVRYFKTALLTGQEPLRQAEAAPSWRRLAGEVLLAYAASRLLMVAVLAVCRLAAGQRMSGLGDQLMYICKRWDAKHYLLLTEHGYVTQGDERLALVFFPLYPMLCRLLWKITGLSAFAVDTAVSNLALLGCGAAVYRLALLDGQRAWARRAMLAFLFCPVTFFYSMPYGESTFLLLTLLAVLCARRRKWWPAVMFGALAAATRMLGLAAAVPIFWEMLRCERDRCEGEGCPLRSRRFLLRAGLCVLRVLPVALGLAAYLGINWRLYGNPLQFLQFQRDNWYQTFGSIRNTLQYSLVNAFTYHSVHYRFGTWGPQTAVLLGVPLALALGRKKLRPGDMAYALVYYFISAVPTWLLSGVRYMSALYPLYLLMGKTAKTKWGFALLLLLETALLCGMCYIGLWHEYVY